MKILHSIYNNKMSIKTRNEILHDIYGQLFIETRFSLDRNIKVISFRESKDDIIDILYRFICENYYNNTRFRWCYSKELFRYFLKDSIVVIFYIPDVNNVSNKIISGIVIGKQIDIMYKGGFDFHQISKSIDVNFLCVRHDLRKLGICNYLINILIKSVLEDDNTINSALFTIGGNKKYHKYSEKCYYSKYIDNNTYNIIDNDIDVDVFQQLELSDSVLTTIKNYIYNDNVKRYDIFQIYDNESLREIMKNNEFIKIFITNKGELLGIIILYHLDYIENQRLFKNVFVYNYFIKNLDVPIWKILDNVCKNIGIDVITSTTQLNDTFINTGTVLNYYDYNLNLKFTLKNGLVTI